MEKWKYLQLAQDLENAIDQDALKKGERLPSLRALAMERNLSRLTVERAYLELEKKGKIQSRQGSGFYVTNKGAISSDFTSDGIPSWQKKFSWESPSTKDSIIYDFSQGIGAQDLMPKEVLVKTLVQELQRDLLDFGYGDPQGALELREKISQLSAGWGHSMNPSSILITTGSQQALSLIFRLLLKPGDRVVIAQPCYSGVLKLIYSIGAEIITLPVDNQGIDPSCLESLMEEYDPKLLYTVPNFQNPTGICLSKERRYRLVDICRKYQLPLVEDDYVGALSFKPMGLPALTSIAHPGEVIYTSTFSKMLLPGLRIGYLHVEGPVLKKLIQFKEHEDLASPYFIQQALARFITMGRYRSHLKMIRREYSLRRDAMVRELEKWQGLEFSPSQGGLYQWCRQKGLDSDRLTEEAEKKGVSIMPGSSFFVDPEKGKPYFRLNFSAMETDRIQEGLRLLKECRESIRL